MRSVEDAARFVKETAIPGEIILLKSAPNLHLERIFDGEVRCWEQVCRKLGHCVDCGSLPYLSRSIKSIGRQRGLRRLA